MDMVRLRLVSDNNLPMRDDLPNILFRAVWQWQIVGLYVLAAVYQHVAALSEKQLDRLRP